MRGAKSMVKTSRVDNLDNEHIEELLSDINNDDTFHELYLLLKSPIYALSLTILKNREDALDNVQDVFITIMNNIDNYHNDHKPMNWIFTITRNKAISKLRKRKEIFDIDDYINKVHFSNKEDIILFKFLMKDLSEEERNIILLHLLWGFKHREIADILDINLSTIISKYNRAIKKLKEMGATI